MNEFIQYKFFWVKLVSSCIMFLWFIHFLVCFSRSFGEGNGTPLRYSWLENPRGRGAWWAAVHGVQRVRHDWATSLSLLTFMHWKGNGNTLQCSCLENPRDGGAWWAFVSGVAQSQTRLKRLSSSIASPTITIYKGFLVMNSATN